MLSLREIEKKTCKSSVAIAKNMKKKQEPCL